MSLRASFVSLHTAELYINKHKLPIFRGERAKPTVFACAEKVLRRLFLYPTAAWENKT